MIEPFHSNALMGKNHAISQRSRNSNPAGRGLFRKNPKELILLELNKNMDAWDVSGSGLRRPAVPTPVAQQ
jgi:hypothetical protein